MHVYATMHCPNFVPMWHTGNTGFDLFRNKETLVVMLCLSPCQQVLVKFYHDNLYSILCRIECYVAGNNIIYLSENTFFSDESYVTNL